MNHKGSWIGIWIVLSTNLVDLGCAAKRHKPCSDGGQPARVTQGKPISGLIKKCNQTVNQDGYLVNHGQYFEWYSNDKVALTGQYENGKKVGRWIEYDPLGKKSSDKYFEEGKEVDAP